MGEREREAQAGWAYAMNGRFCGRLWHALKNYLNRELVSLIAQFLDGWGIQLHWDFLTDTPLRALLPELHARGVPEDERSTDRGKFCDFSANC